MKKIQIKNRFPTREEVLRGLNSGDEPKSFKRYTLLVEYRKISGKLGLISAELFQNNALLAQGKMTQYPQTRLDSFNWDGLRVNENYIEGYALNYQEESFIQIVKQGLRASIKHGRIPFLSKTI